MHPCPEKRTHTFCPNCPLPVLLKSLLVDPFEQHFSDKLSLPASGLKVRSAEAIHKYIEGIRLESQMV